MDPDEVQAMLASLPPEEQAQAISDMGFSQANQVPYSFGGGGAFSPSLPRSSFDLGIMNQIPPDIEYGDVQPTGLDEMSQIYNIMQDIGATSLDPALAMYGGPGAFAVNAFDPTPVPIGDPLDLSGGRYVSMMANTGPGYQSYLAKKIAGGMNPGQAVASMWQAVQTPDENLDPEALAQKQAIVSSLPPAPVDPSNPSAMAPMNAQLVGDYSTPQGQAASADVTGITTFANDLFTKLAEDPQVGYTDPTTGLQYAGVYQQPSPLAEKFHEYGIPLPTEKYTDPQYVSDVDPAFLQRVNAEETAAQDALAQATALRDQTQGNFDTLQKAWNASAGDRAAAAAGPTPTGPADNPYNLPPNYLSGAQEGADLRFNYLKESGGAGMPQRGEISGWQPYKQADAEYDKAYADWETEQKRKALADMSKPVADYLQASGDPYVVSSGNKILGSYNFGDYTQNRDQQQALGKLMTTIGGATMGNNNVQGGFMTPDWQSGGWGDAVQAATDRMMAADTAANQAWWQTDPSELAAVHDYMTGYVMDQQGRTPLNDVLQQRSMSRSTFQPGMYTGY